MRLILFILLNFMFRRMMKRLQETCMKRVGMQRSVNRIEKLKFHLWNLPSHEWRNGFPASLYTNKRSNIEV